MEKLCKGDMIGIAAPSARFDEKRFQKGVQALEKMGFKAYVPQKIYGEKRYLAGEDKDRAQVLNELFSNPEVKGIMAVRGGFGALRILDFLDWEVIRKNPKVFMGFSDATALICALDQRAGILSIHGPNLTSLSDAEPETLKSFFHTLVAGPGRITLKKGEVLIPGKVRGKLTGGNLATLVHMIGTPFQPDFAGKILFIEDVGEPAYKIDRMLSQMKMAGLFAGVLGVVAGSFEDCANPEYISDIFLEIFKEYRVPVLRGLDAGHGSVNLSLVMGISLVLDTERLCLQWEDI